MKLTTKELRAGMTIMVKTGHKHFNNVKVTPNLITSIHHSKMSEVCFESGLVCNFGENTLHDVCG